MKVKDLMTKNPACCTPDTDLNKVAKMMVEHNVGMIPVIDNKDTMKVIGVVTDRDITTRTVAEGRNPLEMRASDVMTDKVVTVNEEEDSMAVARVMEKNMVRRVPVVDERGMVTGIVAQADIALKTSDRTTADVVQEISKPTKR